MQRVLNNLGIGVGGVIGGLIATTAHPGTYQLLFAIDALTFGAYLVALWFVPAPPRVERPRARHAAATAWCSATGPSSPTSVMNAALIGVGFSLLGDIFPAFAEEHGRRQRARDRALLSRQHARDRDRAAAGREVARRPHGAWPPTASRATLWAVAWLIVFAGGWWLTGSCGSGRLRGSHSLSSASASASTAPCRTRSSPTSSKPGLLGRYLALNGFAFQLGGAAGARTRRLRARGCPARPLARRGGRRVSAAAPRRCCLERFIPAAAAQDAAAGGRAGGLH